MRALRAAVRYVLGHLLLIAAVGGCSGASAATGVRPLRATADGARGQGSQRVGAIPATFAICFGAPGCAFNSSRRPVLTQSGIGNKGRLREI